MKRQITTAITIAIIGLQSFGAQAQTSASTSDQFIFQALPDRQVKFNVEDAGEFKYVEFGADQAWWDERNFQRALLFMGKEDTDLARVSFEPSYPLQADGDLHPQQIENLELRLSRVDNYASPNTKIVMNVAADNIDTTSYYKNAQNWSDLVKATAKRIEAAGYQVVSVGPMNEPDYSTHQGNIDDFYDIVVAMRNDPYFDDIFISGGNTLNNDVALEWYDFLKPSGLTEGNTHQLAGEFDTYAAFFATVRANGHRASNDELHNVMEALVGYEYGMETGIWWGPAEYARGEMVKAFDGERLAYAEHRPNWTAAAVYRTPEGKIQAFGGTSERQAANTAFAFIGEGTPMFYDGMGPFEEYVLEMPGGTGYWEGQTNAERVLNVTWGEDIQPAINGRYVMVNKAGDQAMEVTGGSSANGTNIQAGNHTGDTQQQWDVFPVDARIGGDFSYYRILPAASNNQSIDVNNFSLDNGGNIIQWSKGNSGNQQWILEYIEDGWFYVRSRESSLCLEVADDGNVQQWEKTGAVNQMWRLLPADASVEYTAPSAPQGLSAEAQSHSIKLSWTANAESDVAGYTILRTTTPGSAYYTIGRNVSTTSFIDNTAKANTTYYYVIKAVDQSLNRSGYSNEVSAMTSGGDDELLHLSFDGHALDLSKHLNHAALSDEGTFVGGMSGKALSLNRKEMVKISSHVVSQSQMSIAFWINWNGFATNEQIFNFGNGEEEFLSLSPSVGGQMTLIAKYNGVEQSLATNSVPIGEWTHVVINMDDTGVSIYVDGELAAESADFTIRPADFNPISNYLGINPSNKKLFGGLLDDFRIYNYPLTMEERADLTSYMKIESLESGQLEGGFGYADVVVVDADGNPIADAEVTGYFAGDYAETVSATTNANGEVRLQTTAASTTSLQGLDFCVEGVSHASLAYSAAMSAATCTDVILSANDQIEEWLVYPNPASSYIQIDGASDLEVQVINLSGKQLLTTRTDANHRVSIKGLDPGIYALRISDGRKIQTQRLIIQQ